MQLMGTKETKEMKKLKPEPKIEKEEVKVEETPPQEEYKSKKHDAESITKALLQKQNVEHIQFVKEVKVEE